ncbi:MAG: helix-turn-helix domain-containing protein [Aquificaceae bacterium]|nr:helix-turn-helix domain-containing protein [Aquificaceae bacterium]
MPKRIKFEDIQELEKKHLQGEKSQDFKALIVKLVEKLGSVSKVSDLTDVPERTIYDWLEDWNKKRAHKPKRSWWRS